MAQAAIDLTKCQTCGKPGTHVIDKAEVVGVTAYRGEPMTVRLQVGEHHWECPDGHTWRYDAFVTAGQATAIIQPAATE